MNLKPGDLIGETFAVQGTIGAGAFGVVYLCWSDELGQLCAVKTFREEFLSDNLARDTFHKEASIWAHHGRHPNVVSAYFVAEAAERLYIALEYVPPDAFGRCSLEDFLRHPPRPNLVQSLQWSIQICYGMGYAYSSGIKCHRDIKPSNILVGKGQCAKASDFGLAGALYFKAVDGEVAPRSSAAQRASLSFATQAGAGVGTLTHMAPEQFLDARSCDERSDIYSFGVVMYEMASGRLPFLASIPRDNSEEEHLRFADAMFNLHCHAAPPSLNSPMFPLIQRCLQKEPQDRFQTFQELREGLEVLIASTGEKPYAPPQIRPSDAVDWNHKGISLRATGKLEEAIQCFEKSIELVPDFVQAWANKGVSLQELGRFEDAIACFKTAIRVNYRFAGVWNNLGVCESLVGRHQKALGSFANALYINPRSSLAWLNKSNALRCLGRHEESLECAARAVELDPRDPNARINVARALFALSRFEGAVEAFSKALELNPLSFVAWHDKGSALYSLNLFEESLACFRRAVEIEPEDTFAWFSKAKAEEALGITRAADESYRRFLSTAGSECSEEQTFARKRLADLR